MIVPQDGENQYVIVNINKPIHLTLRDPGSYILHAENEASLEILTRKLQSSNMWNVFSSPGAKYLTITSTSNVPDTFEILWKNDITRAAVISINKHGPEVYTSDPYCEENHCGKYCKVYSTTECSSNRIKLPNMTRSFTNCCALFSNFYEVNSSTGYMTNLILKQFKSNFNLPIAIFDHPKKVNCSIEFSIVSGGNLEDLSEPIYMDNFCWVTFVQKASSVYVLQYVFDKWVWMMVAAAFLAITLAWCLMLKFCNKKWNIVASLMDVWALSLLGCISNLPKPRSIKCLVLFYLLFITIIQTGFKTNLAQLLTVDRYETSSNNINDLANSNQPLCTSEGFFKKYFNKTVNITNTYLKVKSKINTYPKRRDFLKHKNCISLIPCREVQLLKNLIKFDYFLDNSLTGSYKFYFKINKRHQFKSYMNTFIKRLEESGIYEYIISNMFPPIKNYKKLKEEETELTVITLEHVYSFYIIWLIGILISIVWIVDNWIVDNWIVDNWIVDNWIEDNWIVDNWIVDNWIVDNWIVDNWIVDNWILDNG
ncbi:hypothetical protein FQA39_LY14549 [Lamprigera yunnana]|nr:hypothetical protein FQA39_LY14549 [Lamprigera yunnana]